MPQTLILRLSLHQILRSLTEGVVGIDLDGRFIFLNPVACHLLGFAQEKEALGHDAYAVIQFIQPDGTPLPRSEHPFWEVLRTGTSLDGWKGWFYHQDGTRFPVQVFASSLAPTNVLPGGLVLSFSDMSERRALKEKLEHLANHDPLTAIKNRYGFFKWLQQSRAENDRYGTPFSLIMYDIDYFKAVNDRFAHQAGDEVLRELVLRVNESLRESDVDGRWGGEEFLVLAPHTSTQGAVELAERLREVVAQTPFSDVGPVTISLGVATYESGETVERLEGRVDKALYRAKDAGRDRVVVAEPDVRQH